MADLAQLGFSVDTSGLAKGEKSLNSFASTGETTESRVNKVNTAMAGMGRSAGQAGIQIQQFVGQVQAGQSPMLALSQQAADLGIVLGAPLLGAITGIAASFAGVLLPSLFDTKTSTEELIEAQESLSEILDTNSDNILTFTDKIKGLVSENEELARIEIAAGINDASKAISSATNQIREASGEYVSWADDVESVSAGLYQLGVVAERTGLTQVGLIDNVSDSYEGQVAGIGEISRYVSNLSDELKISTADALELTGSLANFGGSESEVDALTNALASVGESSGKSNSAFANFASSLTDSLLAIDSSIEKTKLLKTALSNIGVVTDETALKVEKITELYKAKTSVLDINKEQMAVNIALQQAGVAAGSREAEQIESVVSAYYNKKDAIASEIQHQNELATATAAAEAKEKKASECL